MADVKLGKKVFSGVSAVKLNTTDGGTVTYGNDTLALNIAYGDTAPEDTSKLWVKTSEPVNVLIDPNALAGDCMVVDTGATLPRCINDYAAAAAVDNKIYIFGGVDVNDNVVNTINVYDTETSIFSTLDVTLPTAIERLGAAAVGTKIYLFGGLDVSGNELDTIYVFDTEANSITTLTTTLPGARFGLSPATINSKIYLFGGYDSEGYATEIFKFDTLTNTITNITVSPSWIRTCVGGEIATAVIGTKIYLFGGYTARSSAVVDMFDTELDNINQKIATLPYTAYELSAIVSGSKVYLLGGYSSDGGGYLNYITVFDTTDYSSVTLDTTLLTKATGVSAVVGDKLYLIGGRNYSNTYYYSHVFAVQSQLPSGTLYLRETSTVNTFPLLKTDVATVKIGVSEARMGNSDGIAEIVPAALHNGDQWVEI